MGELEEKSGQEAAPEKKDRRKLNDGLSWGEDVTTDQLEIGDHLERFGTPRHSPLNGTVKKVNKVTVDLETLYGGWADKDPIPMTIRIRKKDRMSGNDLVGALVRRGNIVHEIVETP